LAIVKRPRHTEGLSGFAVALGCGTHVRLEPSLTAMAQRLRGPTRHRRNMDQDCHDLPDGEASHSQSVTVSDRLSHIHDVFTLLPTAIN
jgi:hypothetical protein